MPLTIEKRVPSLAEFNYLRKVAEWPLLEDTYTAEGLARSLFGVCIMEDERIVAMGRIVGDNAIYFHISDVIVHPEKQRTGLGQMIMLELMSYIDAVAGKNSNVGLMCSKGREKFYEQFGFVQRPNERFGAGMIKIVQ